MESRTHYIPVSGITIQTITDAISEQMNPATYCPANGFTPELICPAAGWSPPYQFTPPEEWPVIVPQNGTIQFLITDLADLKIYCIVSGTNKYNLKIYGFNDALIAEYATVAGGTATYSIPQNLGYSGTYYTYYKCIISAQLGSGNLTTFSFASGNSQVLELYINAPTLVSCANLVRYCYITIRKVVFSQESYPVLNNLSYMSSNCKVLQEITLPTALPELLDFSRAFEYTNLQKLTMPATLPKVNRIDFIFQYATFGDLILPEMPLLTNIASSFAFANFKSLQFTGTGDSITNVAYAFTNAVNFKTLILPTSLNTLVSMTGMCSSIYLLTENIVLPDNMPLCSTLNQAFYGMPNLKLITFPSTAPALIDLYLAFGNCLSLLSVSPINNNGLMCSARFGYLASLKSLNWPDLTCTSLWIRGTSTIRGALTSVEVNWAASTWLHVTVSQTILLEYNMLSVTEINRIFTALPVVVGGQTINVTNNPGYATCTKAIATDKGWAVV